MPDAAAGDEGLPFQTGEALARHYFAVGATAAKHDGVSRTRYLFTDSRSEAPLVNFNGYWFYFRGGLAKGKGYKR